MTAAEGKTVSSGHLARALHRSAIGDHVLEAALGSVVRSGLDLPALVTAGLITLEPDVDDLGGGWWAELEWPDVLDALDTGRLPATPFQIFVVRAAAAACGRSTTTGHDPVAVAASLLAPTDAFRAAPSHRPRSEVVLVAHDEGPRAGHVDAIPVARLSTHLVYDGPRWLGVYRRTSPLRVVGTRWGPAEVWTVVW